jgi:ribonuclease HI
MTIHAFTDGASRGNPGHSGIGVILKDEEGRVLTSVAEYIGRTTNNLAEYTALITCLELVLRQGCKNLVVHSDSELLVRQMQGKYKVKDARLKRMVARAHTILDSAPFQHEFRHITRERNKEADHLANQGIDTMRPLRTEATGKHAKSVVVREAEKT